MQAGRLDRRPELFRPEGGDDGYSATDGNFVSAGKRWARKLDASDRERLIAQQQGGDITTRWWVRSDSLTRAITTAWRLRHKGTSYEIAGVKEADDGREVGIELTTIRRDD